MCRDCLWELSRYVVCGFLAYLGTWSVYSPENQFSEAMLIMMVSSAFVQ